MTKLLKMNNTNWNLDGLDGLFFDTSNKVASGGDGDIFGFSAGRSHHSVIPPPPTSLDDNFLSQAFEEAPSLEHISFSQFQDITPQAGASARVLNSQRIGKRQNLSQQFSASHKSPKSPRIGVVAPLTTPARNKKPLFRAPYRGETACSNGSHTPKGSERRRQEFPQYVGHSTQRCSQQPTLQSPSPYRSSEDLFSSGLPSGVLDTPASLLVPGVTQDGSARGILKLRPVTEIPQQYRTVFNFPYFNAVQSKVLDDVFYTDRPIVLCAPTGSGKTVIFELAIIRLLLQQAGPDRKSVV